MIELDSLVEVKLKEDEDFLQNKRDTHTYWCS